MKILYLIPEFNSEHGYLSHRVFLPARLLKEQGYEVKVVIYEGYQERLLAEHKDILLWPDVVVLVRLFAHFDMNILPFLKEHGKRVVYETDDDLEDFMLHFPRADRVDFYNNVQWLCRNCDCITTTTDFFAKRLQLRYNKEVKVVPNCIDFREYLPRAKQSKLLRVGWSGGAGPHLDDLLMVAPVVVELQKKFNFTFCLQGIINQPLEAYAVSARELLEWRYEPSSNDVKKLLSLHGMLSGLKHFEHRPYYPASVYATQVRSADLDIGLCPLVDCSFNRSKSALKFYQYAAVGTVTLASDVIPYSGEVNYLARNDKGMQDWKEKLEALIRDRKLRQRLLLEQQAFVKANRDAVSYGAKWVEALKP